MLRTHANQCSAWPNGWRGFARHSDINLTMSRYSHTVLADEAQALDALPAFPSVVGGKKVEAARIVATGTDGRQNVLPSGLPKPVALSSISLRSDARQAAPKKRPSQCRAVKENTGEPLGKRVTSRYDSTSQLHSGEVAERPNAPVLKTGVSARIRRVRIPASPLVGLPVRHNDLAHGRLHF